MNVNDMGIKELRLAVQTMRPYVDECRLLEEENKRLQTDVECLRAIVDQVASRYKIMLDLGPDATGADGEFISAGWLEDVGGDAVEALEGLREAAEAAADAADSRGKE